MSSNSLNSGSNSTAGGGGSGGGGSGSAGSGTFIDKIDPFKNQGRRPDSVRLTQRNVGFIFSKS